MSTFHWLGPIKKEELNLPKDYPNADINLAGYNTGFEESQAVDRGINGSFICTICLGIPKRPIILPRCGHLFCQACIEKVSQSKKVEIFGKVFSSNTCPNCKSSFSQNDTKEFEAQDPWAQRVFKSLQLKCLYECGFKGNSFEMDPHQSFQCLKRKVKCPGEDCGLTMDFDKLRDEHIKTCPKVLIYCNQCMLPVRREKLDSHDCLDRMAQALKGTLYLNCPNNFS